jgi:hypothetical protein
MVRRTTSHWIAILHPPSSDDAGYPLPVVRAIVHPGSLSIPRLQASSRHQLRLSLGPVQLSSSQTPSMLSSLQCALPGCWQALAKPAAHRACRAQRPIVMPMVMPGWGSVDEHNSEAFGGAQRSRLRSGSSCREPTGPLHRTMCGVCMDTSTSGSCEAV